MSAGHAVPRASQAAIFTSPASAPESSQGAENRSLVSWENKSPQHLDGLCEKMPASMVRVTDGKHVQAMTCKMWGCPDCRPRLKRALRDSFRNVFQERPTMRRFATLTLPGEWHERTASGKRVSAFNGATPKERHVALSWMFAQFRKRAARYTGEALRYAAVRELHKDGTPHIHFMVDRDIPWEWLKRSWAEVGGGYVDIRRVHPRSIGAYLAKYLSKDDELLPKGVRKYASGGGVKLESVRPKGDGSWWIEVKTTLSSGKEVWWWTPDPRAVLGMLAQDARLRQGPPESLIERARARGWGRVCTATRLPSQAKLCGCQGAMACSRCTE